MRELVQNYPWLSEAWQQWNHYRQKLGHAYLFVATEGVGVESLVAAVAQSCLCTQPDATGHACGQCQNCHLYACKQHPDYYHLSKLEGKKEIAIDQVRELVAKQTETSHQGGRKVVWIESVESMSISAFNALLKTLEEPNGDSIFLLTTAQLHRLPATIKSRCQLLKVSAPSLAQSSQWLAQQCPQTDAQLIKRALRLNWNAPLAAKRWLASGELEQHNQWLEQLDRVLQGREVAKRCVDAWLKWEQPNLVLDYFYQQTQQVVRQLGYQSPVQNSAVLQSWLRFEQVIGQARRQWAGNANPSLLLENLLTLWLALKRSPENAFDAFEQNPFESQWIRGEIG